MPNFSSLSLGSRKDADRWRRGMKEKLSFNETKWIKNPQPTWAEYEGIFSSSDNWIFFAGHFSKNLSNWGGWSHEGDYRLYNDVDNTPITPPTSEILFRPDHVLVRRLEAGTWSEKTFRRGIEFKQHLNCKVILWGGCDVCSNKAQVKALQKLFGEVVIIGWVGQTGWQIVDIMLGGHGDDPDPGTWKTPNFWNELGNGYGDPVKVRDAWLKVARAINWGGNTLERFCVVDPDGAFHNGTDEPLVS